MSKQQSIFRSTQLQSLAPGILHGFFSSAVPLAELTEHLAPTLSNNSTAQQPISTITPKQIHSNICLRVLQQPHDQLIADALMTTVPYCLITIQTADCMPILLGDPKRRLVAVVHAGWKGAVNGIIENSIASMCQAGSHREDIHAVIGPCIHQHNYEVQDDFCQQILSIDQSAEKYINQSPDDRCFFNLPGYGHYCLQQSGIQHIDDINLDTYENDQFFHSYRRATHQHSDRIGRQYSAIMLT